MKICFLLAVLVMVSVPGANAQSATTTQPGAPTAPPQPAKPVIPDKFTNLVVLPKNIEKSDLVALMKGFSITFKVRCSYCHVATDDLSSADFPSDEKPTKQNTRELLRRLTEIQEEYREAAAPVTH